MLAEQYDVFFIDLDGVIYREGELLPGSEEGIEKLRKLGKKIRFVTNDPRFLRQELCTRLLLLGIEASQEECITAGWTTAHYIAQQAIDKVYVIGTNSLKTEIRSLGINVIEQGDCQAVIVGYDENTTFHQVQQAVNYIGAGAKFIATNEDYSFPSREGRCVATGAIVAAVQKTSQKRPIIIGKPHPHIFRMALKSVDPNARIVMIGDSPELDILGAHQFGLDGILVQGEPTSYPSKYDYRKPETVIPNLSFLFDPNIVASHWKYPGFSWPDSIEAGVAAVLFNEFGQVFLVKREDNGMWGLPSGHVEIGETVEEAVIRELKEETGLSIAVQKLIGVYSDPISQIFAYPSGKITHFITACFLCNIIGGEMNVDQQEIVAASFFDIQQLPSNLLTMHPQWLSDALANRGVSFVR